jgi:hypothetical protein
MRAAASAERANPGSHPPVDAQAHRGKLCHTALENATDAEDARRIGRSEEERKQKILVPAAGIEPTT